MKIEIDVARLREIYVGATAELDRLYGVTSGSRDQAAIGAFTMVKRSIDEVISDLGLAGRHLKSAGEFIRDARPGSPVGPELLELAKQVTAAYNSFRR